MTPAPQLYLITPPAPDPERLAPALASVVKTGLIAAVLLGRDQRTDEGLLRHRIDRLRPIAQDHGVAFLVEDAPALANETGCDGVHRSLAGPTVRECRKLVGANGVIGAACGFSRHLAMEAAEQGADYVSFGRSDPAGDELAETLSLLEWWAGIMEIPCVGRGVSRETAAAFAATGAEFLAVEDVWGHPEGADEALKTLASALRSEAR